MTNDYLSRFFSTVSTLTPERRDQAVACLFQLYRRVDQGLSLDVAWTDVFWSPRTEAIDDTRRLVVATLALVTGSPTPLHYCSKQEVALRMIAAATWRLTSLWCMGR